MNYEDHVELLETLRSSRKYVQQAHDEAEAKHDSYGEDYMSGALYEVMCDTESILKKIDSIITKEP